MSYIDARALEAKKSFWEEATRDGAADRVKEALEDWKGMTRYVSM